MDIAARPDQRDLRGFLLAAVVSALACGSPPAKVADAVVADTRAAVDLAHEATDAARPVDTSADAPEPVAALDALDAVAAVDAADAGEPVADPEPELPPVGDEGPEVTDATEDTEIIVAADTEVTETTVAADTESGTDTADGPAEVDVAACATASDCPGAGPCSPITCASGQCVGGKPVSCDDGNGCTSDACDTASGCIHLPVAGTCTAWGPCAAEQVCAAGVCKGSGWLDCDDGNACTSDQCDPTWGCVFAPLTGPCDDGDACTTGDTCASFACVPSGKLACSDGDPCSVEACLPAKGCVIVPAAVACDDANACTSDGCGASGCFHLPAAATCSDADLCTTGDACKAGACVQGGLLLCNDSQDCTYDACVAAAGCVFTPVLAPCSDGSACTIGDKCLMGKCKPGALVDCEDGKPCTVDACSESGGCAHYPVYGPCGSGGSCLPDGSCCQPACTGKQCGGDGCGGSCGSCPSGTTCSATGQCAVGGCGSVTWVGCCKGNVSVYCMGGKLEEDDCAQYGEACGWKASGGYYDCGGSGADPSGKYPLKCQGNCVAKFAQGCCGNDVCWFDSCGNVGEVAQKCTFGCDAGLKQCQPDACQGVPTTGVCTADGKAIATCVVTTGQGGGGYVSYSPCGTGTACAMQGGKAVCKLQPGFCVPQTSECDPVNPNLMRVCGSDAKWTSLPCPGCKPTPAGPLCLGDIALQPVQVTYQYEFKQPNATLTNWGTEVKLAPVAGALVYTRRTFADGSSVWLDAAVANEAGQANIQVPVQAQAGDEVVLALLTRDGTGAVQCAVAAPDAGKGEQDITAVKSGKHVVWSWAQPVQSLAGGGQTLTISLANGSGAARLFAQLRSIWQSAAQLFGKPGAPLVVWASPGTSWNCGACFWDGLVTKVGAATFPTSIWVSWTTQDEGVWADAVTAHEVGHWVMHSFGKSPGEGGTHFLGVPTFPGQAWSEGFATWLSSMARGSPLYADKQSGSFFWVDIAQKVTSKGKPFVPATASGGLLQKMDEDLVSAMLWQISATTQPVPLVDPANASFWSSLASPRMTVPPYGRGYTRHKWVTVYPGQFLNVYDTGISVPMVADYFDAWLCGGGSASAVQAAVLQYPYVATAPWCTPGAKP